jgi:YVTN family beta-propeller protein
VAEASSDDPLKEELMKAPSGFLRLTLTALVAGGVVSSYLPWARNPHAQAPAADAVSSAPLALDRTNQYLWAVNPDNDSVSVFRVGNDAHQKLAEVPVGDEPQSVALARDYSKAYVSNTVSGTVSVVNTNGYGILKTIPVGTEPWALALTPNGTRLYVANSSSNTVTIIDTATDEVARTIYQVGVQPRAIAITNDGDGLDSDEKVYVTSLLAQYRQGEVRPGEDLGKVGRVSVISTQNDSVIGEIELQPIANTGFRSNGDSLMRVPASNPPTLFDTGAFPNILVSLAVKHNWLFVPSTGSSPNGPDLFNVNVQSLVSVVDTLSDTDTGKTVNVNSGINLEPDVDDAQGRPLKRFVTNPYFLAFRHLSNSGYIISAASDMAVKLDLSADGTPTINPPAGPGQPSNVKRILAGKNPRAMVINSDDTRGYIWNYVSRDLTVVNLADDTVLTTLVSAAQPTDPQDVIVQRGKELFNTSIGPIVPKSGVNEGLMADHGWVSCASCHPDGLTDGVAWMFPSGPRISTSLNGTFSKEGPLVQRTLNWSGIFDEVADFELNTRNTAGGRGLILLADNTPDPNVRNFDPASGGRNADRDAITEYFKSIRSPISPIPENDPHALQGRKVFRLAGCVQCHNGPLWTSSRVEFPPPPPAAALVTEQGIPQLVGQLKQVGTFDPSQPFEVIGKGPNLGKQALGEKGFNTPSLLGIFALGPYLHNGTVVDLEGILDNPAHVGDSHLLSSPGHRRDLVRFLKSIDDSTPPFP